MLASELNRRITIEKKLYSKNTFGESQEAWYILYEIAAKIIFNSGKRLDQDQVTTNIYDTEFWVRSYANIAYDCRVKYNGSIYIINYIEEIGLRGKEGYKLKCTRTEQDG